MNPAELFSNSAIGQLGFGGLAGAAVGYTAKKVTKLIAILLGATFILVQVLVHYGLITVNWGAVESSAHGVWAGPDGVTLADRAWAIVRDQLPFGGAFVVGFALGFKLG
jgi:uncharacterized membrane protein (Fun14 family)